MLKVGDDHFVASELLRFVRSRRDRVIMMFSRQPPLQHKNRMFQIATLEFLIATFRSYWSTPELESSQTPP
jgi:hypothetical protein